MANFFIGRQPIFNQKLDVVAYELLYRSMPTGGAGVIDGDKATTDVILNTFAELGPDNLVGKDGVAYINATRNFLTGKYPIQLPPERIVLEVLEDITIDRQLIAALSELAKRGYTIALDDVVSLEAVQHLLPLASIVKIEIQEIKPVKLATMVRYLKGNGITVLAEKVETQKEFSACKNLGFDTFQGYFLCKPNIVKGHRLDSSRLVIMHSLARLQDSEVDFHQLEEIVAQDVSLGYKLLKLVNSAYYSTTSQVESLAQAISFIGMKQLSGWMTLLLLSSFESKPHELTTIAMTRAKMCELLGRATGARQVDTYFMVGLFSILDALTDQPLYQAISGLPISDETAAALLHHKGQLGSALSIALAYEQGDWNHLAQIKVNHSAVQQSYLQAIKWAEALTEQLAEIEKTAVK